MLHSTHVSLKSLAELHHSGYKSNSPYSHMVLDDFLDEEIIQAVIAQFPDLSRLNDAAFNDSRQIKFALNSYELIPTAIKAVLNFFASPGFLHFLQNLTDIEECILPDPYLVGGGLHEIKRGGLLEVHADFNTHPKTKLQRRLNVILYLNEDWQEDYGGHLELWDEQMTSCSKAITPIANRLVVFSTTSTSYHGHPKPLLCPPSRSRKSIALYYYTNTQKDNQIAHSTLFQKRPEDAKSDTSPRKILKVLKLLTPPIIWKAGRYMLR